MTAGPTRSEASAFTLDSASPSGARTTIWKASYSFRAALIVADRAVPGGSVRCTRVRVSTTQTVGSSEMSSTSTAPASRLFASLDSAIAAPASAATMM